MFSGVFGGIMWVWCALGVLSSVRQYTVRCWLSLAHDAFYGDKESLK